MGADSNATSIIGGLPPPPGVTPNFVNPESLHSEWVLMMSMCLTFTTIFVFLRMYTKLVIIKSHGWEDCKLRPNDLKYLRFGFLIDLHRYLFHRMGTTFPPGRLSILFATRRQTLIGST